ncbi:MAG: hypothetical protein AAF431_04130 [Pseudomonadota bacterium]
MRLLVLLLLTTCFAAAANSGELDAPDAEQLIGQWKVDLRPTPDAEAYFQEFSVSSVNGNTFSGTFYGTPITQARINTDWHTIRVAFVTEDQSGQYHHSAVMNGDKLEGLSNSTGRDFLSYWSATKISSKPLNN